MNTRSYVQTRRAEQQAETRQRIVQAAVDLHGTVGPAMTTMTKVAERAGVQRNTLYAHFPDERSLFMACSQLSLDQDPPPDATPWRGIGNAECRLQTGLSEVYRWYVRTEGLTGCVLRDAEVHPLTREVTALRLDPVFDGYAKVLGEGLRGRQKAVLKLAISFHTWRTLVTESGLTSEAAAETMARATLSAV